MKALLLILALFLVGADRNYVCVDDYQGVYAYHVHRVQYGLYIVETSEGNYTLHEGAWFGGPDGPHIHWAKRYWLDTILTTTRYGRLPIVY